MLEFLKRLLGLGPKVEQVAAPYKVEAPASTPLVSQPLRTTNLLYTPEVSPVVETAPVAAAAPAQADKKAATGTTKSTGKKGAETGAKPARRRKKPAAT
jgi:hypothetical protein